MEAHRGPERPRSHKAGLEGSCQAWARRVCLLPSTLGWGGAGCSKTMEGGAVAQQTQIHSALSRAGKPQFITKIENDTSRRSAPARG